MKRVALLHGFLGSTADWADTLACLAPSISCDVVPLSALDCSSVHSAALSLRDRLLREPCDAVVGYSLGGRIALELAVVAPECVRELLLLSTHPGITDAAERLARATEDDRRAHALVSQGIASFVDEWYRTPLFASFRAHPSFENCRARREKGDAAFWSSVIAGCSPGRSPPRWETLAQHAAKSTVAAGAADDRYASIVRQVQVMAPALRTHLVAGAGHVLPLEAPADCARLIVSTLDSLRNLP